MNVPENKKVFFNGDTVIVCCPSLLNFDKEAFVQRLDFFVRMSLEHNHCNQLMYGSIICKQQYDLTLSCFIKSSYILRFKDAVTNCVDDLDLFDSYKRLCIVGINQFLFKLIELQKTSQAETNEHFFKANMIIKEGITALADDVDELFKR